MIESNLLPPEKGFPSCDLFGPPKEIKPVTMLYRSHSREKLYEAQPDVNFKYNLLCAFAIFLCLAALQFIVFEWYEGRIYISLPPTLMLFLYFLQGCSLIRIFGNKYGHDLHILVPKPLNNGRIGNEKRLRTNNRKQ